MGLFRRAMELFPFVFHPSTVIGFGVLLLVHHEWRNQSTSRAVLGKRVAAFLGAGILAFVPTAAYFLVARGSLSYALEGSSWRLDAMVAAGIFVAAGITWYLWHRFDWGQIVPDAMAILAAVTVPYLLISPFWDISGHVIMALMPTLYLALVDRRFLPLVAVPVAMVPNRVIVNAHTWEQSVAGFLVAAVITVGLYLFRTRRRLPPSDRPTAL